MKKLIKKIKIAVTCPYCKYTHETTFEHYLETEMHEEYVPKIIGGKKLQLSILDELALEKPSTVSSSTLKQILDKVETVQKEYQKETITSYSEGKYGKFEFYKEGLYQVPEASILKYREYPMMCCPNCGIFANPKKCTKEFEELIDE